MDNWYDDVGNSEGFGHFRTKIFNSEILLPILDQNGEYSIIFRFEHSFKEDTFGPFFNSIYLDQVKFYINYTAKEIYPNETITITQEIENYNEILEDSLLSSQIRSNISFPELNFDNWSFWVSVNQYSLKNYSLNSFPDNNWFFESSPIPKEELSSKNITLSFNLHYNGTEVLRFNKSDSWSLFFDNVSLISNLSYNWSDISEYVDFYNFKDSPTFNLHRTQFLTNKNHPSGAKYPYFYISKNQSLPDVWLSSLLPKILFNSSQDFLSEPIEFQGNLQKIHLSWRDFLYNNVKGLISQLDGYFSLIQSEIVYGIDEWDDLLRLHSLFEDISTLNLDNLLIKSYLLDPSLPRPITSYIQYIELNSQLSVQTFGDFAKNIFEQSSASNLTRKTRIIRDVVNSTFNSTIKDYNSVLSSLLSSISQIPLETIPEGLNISKMYFLLQNIRSQITNNKLNEGFSFFLKDDYYEFPSLVFYRNLANNMEQNLKSNFFNNLDDSTNFFPFEWLWENNLDAEFHFGMNKNNSKIPQGIPVLFTESYSSFPASNLTFSTLNLPMVYFHSLSLFHSLFISFDSLVKINNLFDHFTNLTNIVNISISEMEIIDKESFCKNLFSDEDSIVFNTFDLNHNLYSDLDYYIGDVKTPIYLEHKINLSFTPLLLSTANSQSQTLLKTEIFLPIFEPQISTKYIKAQTINNEINVSKIDFSNEFISFPSTIQDTLTTLIFLQGNFSVGDFLQAPIIKTSIIVDNEIVFQNSTSFHVLSLSSSLSQENIEEIYNKETLIKSLNYNLQSKQYKFISLPILPMRSSFHIDWLQGEPHTVAIFNIINAVSSNNLNISSLSVSIEDSSYSNSLGSYVFSTQKIQNCPYYQFQINFGRLDTIITGSNIENQNLIVKIIMEAENLVENEIIFDEIIFSAYYYPPLTTKDPVIATRMIVFLISLMCIAAIFVIMNIYHRFIKKTMIMDD